MVRIRSLSSGGQSSRSRNERARLSRSFVAVIMVEEVTLKSLKNVWLALQKATSTNVWLSDTDL